MESRVYILGAGCSYDQQCGYPLAKQFIPALSSYAQEIGSDHQRQQIKKVVQDTIALLTQCQSGACYASTTDQLINLILSGRLDDELRAQNTHAPFDNGLRRIAVRAAKIATSACFLEIEGAVRQNQIGRYRDFIQRKVLSETGLSTPTRTRLAKSSARVLTFNYDRLFELAFFGAVADDDVKMSSPYQAGVLNSGINGIGDFEEIAKNKFCFLKLHGSIGVLCNEDPPYQNVWHLRKVADWKDEPVTDKLFFNGGPPPRIPIEPLIAFPYEKDWIMSGKQNKLPFRQYIETVWVHATEILKQASEIWIIGYSFDPTDAQYLVDPLRQAQRCRRIVIQNLATECDRIEALLRTEYGLQIPVEKYCVRF